MKKVLSIILSLVLSLSLVGCVTEKKIKENIEKVDQDKSTEPANVSPSEKKEDENFKKMADEKEKIDKKSLIGDYEIVILSISGTTYVKDSEEWKEIFGEEEEDIMSIRILNKKNLEISSYGDVTKNNYILEGNVMRWVEGEHESEEESVLTALVIDGLLVVDLDDAKMYFARKDDPEGIEKAVKVCEQIEQEAQLEQSESEEKKEDEN
ncbi:MAG: hypothetical protein KBT48_09115 [Firmicutes bacterium]|nr:hypothetical protein [Bacillota bacterium]